MLNKMVGRIFQKSGFISHFFILSISDIYQGFGSLQVKKELLHIKSNFFLKNKTNKKSIQ